MKVGRLLIVASAIALSIGMVACGGEEEELLTKQQEAIEKYLDGKGLEYTIEGGAYKVIAAPGDESGVRAERGDSLAFNYAAYIFTTSPNGLYATSWAHLVEGQEGLNTQYWDFSPAHIKLGESPIIKGVENALENCCIGDSLHIFMTSELGYGAEEVGSVNKNNALMFIVKVENIYN